MFRTVTTAGAVRERHLADAVQKIAMVNDPVANDVDDLALLLHPALHADHRGGHDGSALALEPIGPQDAGGDSGFVFDRNEQHALGRSWLLANEDDTGDLDMASVADSRQVRAFGNAPSGQFVTDEGQRMRAQRELQCGADCERSSRSATTGTVPIAFAFGEDGAGAERAAVLTIKAVINMGIRPARLPV